MSSATGVGGDQSDNSVPGAGAVYVFTRSGSTWVQQAYVKASNAYVMANNRGGAFGSSVSLSADGDTLAVGAFGEDSNATGVGGDQTNNLAENAGAAYIFRRTGGVWTQQAYIKASNAESQETFGGPLRLSADGTTLAVGAYRENSGSTGINGNQADNSAMFAGAVYVFIQRGGAWSQQAYVKASNAQTFDFFGLALDLSADGNTLAIGATGEDSIASGANGDQLDEAASNTGAVYVFTRSVDQWSQTAYLKPSNPRPFGEYFFGSSIAMSADGTVLAVGARDEPTYSTGINGSQVLYGQGLSGAVYVFERVGGDWSQRAYVKASNTDGLDGFGSAVTMSGDGNTLAVSARNERSNATGINGDQANNSVFQAGAVYLY